jgi:hypothetical protein
MRLAEGNAVDGVVRGVVDGTLRDADLGRDYDQPDPLDRTGKRMRVGLEIGTFKAGPLVGSYLASLGTDVIKIESVKRPDLIRFTGRSPRTAAGNA